MIFSGSTSERNAAMATASARWQPKQGMELTGQLSNPSLPLRELLEMFVAG
jgi:hypothetical protein